MIIYYLRKACKLLNEPKLADFDKVLTKIERDSQIRSIKDEVRSLLVLFGKIAINEQAVPSKTHQHRFSTSMSQGHNLNPPSTSQLSHRFESADEERGGRSPGIPTTIPNGTVLHKNIDEDENSNPNQNG